MGIRQGKRKMTQSNQKNLKNKPQIRTKTLKGSPDLLNLSNSINYPISQNLADYQPLQKLIIKRLNEEYENLTKMANSYNLNIDGLDDIDLLITNKVSNDLKATPNPSVIPLYTYNDGGIQKTDFTFLDVINCSLIPLLSREIVIKLGDKAYPWNIQYKWYEDDNATEEEYNDWMAERRKSIFYKEYFVFLKTPQLESILAPTNDREKELAKVKSELSKTKEENITLKLQQYFKGDSQGVDLKEYQSLKNHFNEVVAKLETKEEELNAKEKELNTLKDHYNEVVAKINRLENDAIKNPRERETLYKMVIGLYTLIKNQKSLTGTKYLEIQEGSKTQNKVNPLSVGNELQKNMGLPSNTFRTKLAEIYKETD